MNLYRVVPPPPEVYDLSAESSRQAIEQLYQPEGSSSVRAIMVTNSAGDTIGPQGSSQGLSQGADRALLSILRENSDAVVVGASTIRREPVPLPRTKHSGISRGNTCPGSLTARSKTFSRKYRRERVEAMSWLKVGESRGNSSPLSPPSYSLRLFLHHETTTKEYLRGGPEILLPGHFVHSSRMTKKCSITGTK